MLKMLDFDQIKLKLNDSIFDNLHYRYRGEGNENLVLSLPEIKFVLRLRKSNTNEDVNPSNEKNKLTISLLYYYCLMNPFFSEKYLTIPIIAEISETVVKHLDEKLFGERPEHRRDKRIAFGGVEMHPDYTFLSRCNHYQGIKNHPVPAQGIETDLLRKAFTRKYLDFRNYVHALLTSAQSVNDLSFGQSNFDGTTFSIEIKPKQAWIAEPYRKFDVCAYCMNQYFKLHERKIENKSEYCPMDLFSGCENRMQKALEGLLSSPQNNLRIFKDGELVFGEAMSHDIERVLSDLLFKSQDDEGIKRCKSHFCKLLIAILKNDFTVNEELKSFKVEPYSSSNQYKICCDEKAERMNKLFHDSNLKCDYNTSSLPKNCILSRIMELQKLDDVGLEVVYDFSKTHMRKNLDEFSHIDNLISNVTFQSGDITMPILNVAEAYTLSTAGKDLSIMIAVKNVPSDSQSTSEWIVNVDDLKYEFSVSVVDVGPKPLSCIKKHWKRDKNILESCLNYFNSQVESCN